jgi:hypothetical protein
MFVETVDWLKCSYDEHRPLTEVFVIYSVVYTVLNAENLLTWGDEYFTSALVIHCVHTGSGAHPASCTMGTGGPFPGAKAKPNDKYMYQPL